MKKQQILFLAFLGLFSAGLVCLSLGFALYWAGSIQQSGNKPVHEASVDPGEQAAQEIARAVNASVRETGSQKYPWGSVRVFEGLSQDNDPVVIEVDRASGLVTAYETYGPRPVKVTIHSDQAVEAAEQFLNAYVPGLNLDGYQRTILLPEEGALLQAYRVTWQKYASSGAVLPQRVVVYVNGETGQVRHFMRTELAVKVDTNPNITSQEILDLFQKAQQESGQEMEIDGLQLAVISDANVESGQRLVWIVPIVFRDIILDSTVFRTFYIDAHTGEVVDLGNLLPEE